MLEKDIKTRLGRTTILVGIIFLIFGLTDLYEFHVGLLFAIILWIISILIFRNYIWLNMSKEKYTFWVVLSIIIIIVLLVLGLIMYY